MNLTGYGGPSRMQMGSQMGMQQRPAIYSQIAQMMGRSQQPRMSTGLQAPRMPDINPQRPMMGMIGLQRTPTTGTY